MTAIDRQILEQVIRATAEPLLIVRVDHPDWPVALAGPAFAQIGGDDTQGMPFADIVEKLLGRDIALDVSQTLRSREETSFAVEVGGREYLLTLMPLGEGERRGTQFYVAFWRGAAGVGAMANSEAHNALLRAKRDLRNLAREDPITGLLNERAFREALEHDWAVSAREKRPLALVTFTLDDFDAYVDVFGRHAADTCLRRVGGAVRRCLRRASDVVGRLDGAVIAVLAHSPDPDAVREFAGRIATAVRELGLHHPRSGKSRFVTISYRVEVAPDPGLIESATGFLDALLAKPAD